MKNIYFSIYHRHTKSPLDNSYICKLNWNTKDIKYIMGPGRISGLCKVNKYTLGACCGTGIKFFNTKNDTFLSKNITHKLINQSHSLCYHQGVFYLCSSGMDLILAFKDQKLINQWNPIHKHNLGPYKNKDYRMVPYKNTGFHNKHLNHILIYNQYIYVLAGIAHKYYVLDKNLNEINCYNIPKIKGQILHDGIVIDDKLFFTGSHGHLYILNLKTSEIKSKKILKPWVRGMIKFKQKSLLIGRSGNGGSSNIYHITTEGSILNKISTKTPIDSPQIYSIVTLQI